MNTGNQTTYTGDIYIGRNNTGPIFIGNVAGYNNNIGNFGGIPNGQVIPGGRRPADAPNGGPGLNGPQGPNRRDNFCGGNVQIHRGLAPVIIQLAPEPLVVPPGVNPNRLVGPQHECDVVPGRACVS